MLLGDIARQRGDTERATAVYQTTLEVFEQINDDWGQADVLRRLGSSSAETGQAQVALRYLERARECYERLGASDLAADLELEIQQLGSEAPA